MAQMFAGQQAGFDLLIIEDAPSMGNASTIDLRIRQAFGAPKHDPLLLAPYLFDVKTDAGGIHPVKEREIIRAAGPTVREDLGKQAGQVNV